MEHDDAIPEVEQAQQLVLAAFNRGYAAGQQAALAGIVAAAQAGLMQRGGVPRASLLGGAYPPPVEGDEGIKKAPRGLLDEVLQRVISAAPGMTTQEVEYAVTKADDRIALRSVYNRLRHLEKNGERYFRRNNRWYELDLSVEPNPPSDVEGSVWASDHDEDNRQGGEM